MTPRYGDLPAHRLSATRPADALPAYDDLPGGRAWEVWPDPRRGALALLTSEAALRGRDCVRTGRVFSLDLDFDTLQPPLFGRAAARHEIIHYPSAGQDDLLSGWNTQAGSQWDGFRHQRHPDLGWFGGLPADQHGIGHWGGIATRGVLADIPAWRLATAQDPLPYDRHAVISAADLRACLDHQGVVVAPGDVLLVRTGWLTWYRGLSAASREQVAGIYTGPGLTPDTARFLWDAHVCAVAADNPTLEAWPKPRTGLSLHNHLLNLLGVPIGELWDLDPLAADCATTGTWDCLLASAPITLRPAAGSPANALALR